MDCISTGRKSSVLFKTLCLTSNAFLTFLYDSSLATAEDGILRTEEFDSLEWDEEDHFAPLADILRVHEWTYVRKIQVQSCLAL